MHSTHYGHKLSLGHLRICDEEHTAIAQQLRQGVDFEHILEKIRDNVGKQFQRLHLLTRKDINNIELAYGFKGTQRHNDDATSVQILVEEMKMSESNRIILYKPQGMPQPEACENMCNNDFMLVIQTHLQAEIIKKYSYDRVICIDSTHGTNGYDFTLITIVVIDDFGEGFPVALCISNR